MSVRRQLLLLAAGAIALIVVASLLAVSPSEDDIALALLTGCVAAGAAIAGGAGRPLLAAAAFAGVGAYAAGLLSNDSWLQPAAILVAAAIGAGAGVVVALAGARLSELGFLLFTAMLAIAGGAAVQALPTITGAERGLGPLPGLGLPLSGDRVATLSPLADLQVATVLAVLALGACALVDASHRGAAWRAAGSDPARARGTGIGVVRAGVGAVAIAAGVAAAAGAVGAHIQGVASPSWFAIDSAALPLLAALAARNRPAVAGVLAALTSVAGSVVIPDAGWQGPPSASAAALGVLAVVAAVSLLWRRSARRDASTAIDANAPWPVDRGFEGAALQVPATTERAPGGSLILDAPAINVAARAAHALVGVNGSGKSTLLRRIARDHAGTGVLLLPQDGGGFPACTALETLSLAARRGGAVDPGASAHQWLGRLGLATVARRRCADLSTGERRLLDLARVLLARPRILLCDEPLAGLDATHRAAVLGCLGAAVGAGLTVLVADHDRAALTTLTPDATELHRPEGGALTTAVARA